MPRRAYGASGALCSSTRNDLSERRTAKLTSRLALPDDPTPPRDGRAVARAQRGDPFAQHEPAGRLDSRAAVPTHPRPQGARTHAADRDRPPTPEAPQVFLGARDRRPPAICDSRPARPVRACRSGRASCSPGDLRHLHLVPGVGSCSSTYLQRVEIAQARGGSLHTHIEAIVGASALPWLVLVVFAYWSHLQNRPTIK